MTRSEAIAAGKSTYFTGKPCKHGHVAERYVKNWTCVACHALAHKEYAPKWWAANPDKAKAYNEKYAKRHAETNKAWRERNKEKCAEQRLAWQRANREKVNEWSKEWRKANRSHAQALKVKRKADILSRTPEWLTDDDKWLINEIYDLAALRTKVTGIEWHVDHIIPLRGKRVSGLHVPSNLQVIPGALNIKKGNKYAV